MLGDTVCVLGSEDSRQESVLSCHVDPGDKGLDIFLACDPFSYAARVNSVYLSPLYYVGGTERNDIILMKMLEGLK